MAFSTAVSVAAFSVVLTQSFVAVAASTLVPATFLAAARAARAAAASSGGSAASTTGDALVTSAPGVSEVMEGLRSGVGQLEEIDLLVPKSARIEAEFEFEASEAYSGEASLGVTVQVVSVAAGYSALYQTSTRNKIRLEVDFATVNYRLAPVAPPAPPGG